MSSKTVALLFLAVLMLSFVGVKCWHVGFTPGKRSQVTAAETLHRIKSSQNASKAFLLKELCHCTHRAKKVPLFSDMF